MVHSTILKSSLFIRHEFTARACIPTNKAGPLNGKHKIIILCALCVSAVKKAFEFQ
jgi:hypothetical protein